MNRMVALGVAPWRRWRAENQSIL